MILSCIIIEDEPLASEKLKSFISRVPFLELLTIIENPVEALHYLKENCIDIIFLDIQMNEITGIQLLETMQTKLYIIITSAFAEYALKGYEMQVFDYLLKPYSFERFLSAVTKVYDDNQTKHISNKCNHIFIKTEYRVENVNIDEILYIEGMQNYLRIVLPGNKIMTKQSFSALSSLLPTNNFIRVHKSWIVNISKIKSIERNRISVGDIMIPIGDTYKESFYRRINQ
jgi:two-component system LytT family response regulator